MSRTGDGPSGPLDRRRFLAALGGATATLALAGPAATCAPRPGRGAIDRVGLQLYTVRSLMSQDVERTLGQVASVGYREVEFAGYFDHAPARLREILDANGLTAPSAHVGMDALEGDDWPRTLEAATILGHRYLVFPWIPPEARRSLDDYRRIAARLEEAGARAREANLRLAYHNHDFEFGPLDGVIPYDILAGTDPDLVQLQLDIYWIRKGGADPLVYFRRHPGRFPSVHVKDMAADGAMVDVGAGVIDWRALFAHADTAGIRHYFVEHDSPTDPLASIRNSYEHLRGLERWNYE
ncbi:MAG: sugar phosphate isomerase/epimerase family protein [Longimicrobiales bacterium]